MMVIPPFIILYGVFFLVSVPCRIATGLPIHGLPYAPLWGDGHADILSFYYPALPPALHEIRMPDAKKSALFLFFTHRIDKSRKGDILL